MISASHSHVHLTATEGLINMTDSGHLLFDQQKGKYKIAFLTYAGCKCAKFLPLTVVHILLLIT